MASTKWFELVDEDGNAVASADTIDVTTAAEDVDAFRVTVMAKCPKIVVLSSDLTVYANRAAQQPLEEDALIGTFGGSKSDPLIVVLPPARFLQQQQMQQLALRRVKRVGFHEWFVSEQLLASTTVALRPQRHQQAAYFDIGGFPPVMHQGSRFKRVMERQAYVVIFNGMMTHVMNCFNHQYAGHVVVVGNPGIGKSRFYLYCAFRLVTEVLATTTKSTAPPPFLLVLNCLDTYYAYETTQQEFRRLTEDEVDDLSCQRNVLRLVDGNDFNRPEKQPWSGVSVLFGSSPNAVNVRNFKKDECQTFILPTWSLDELKEYNDLLDGNRMKLPVDELEARYYKFGGIVRSIFCANQLAENVALESALDSFDAMTVIEYARTHRVVVEDDSSHRVLQMVPSNLDSYRESSFLVVLSECIWHRLLEKAAADSDCRETLCSLHPLVGSSFASFQPL